MTRRTADGGRIPVQAQPVGHDAAAVHDVDRPAAVGDDALVGVDAEHAVHGLGQVLGPTASRSGSPPRASEAPCT